MNANIEKILSSTIFKNMASLGLLQIANYVIPLLIIPFVVRALGSEYFGRASYAQNIVFYLTIIVNFGFEYSATQDIALNKDNHRRTREIFWAIIKFKLLLLAASFVILLGVIVAAPRISDDFTLYIYAALINIGFAICPTWFFQGMEEMEKLAIANVIVKLLGAALIIVFIRDYNDYRLYILLLSLAQIAVGAGSCLYVIQHYRLHYTQTDSDTLKHVVLHSFPIFLNNLFATLYTTSGMTVLGIYATDAEVGVYAGVYKIISAIVTLSCMPISFAIFPMLSRKFKESQESGWGVYKRCTLYSSLFGAATSLITFATAPLVVSLFLGSEFASATPLLRLLSPIPFLVIVSTMFTIQGLYGIQLQRFAPIVGGSVGLFCVAINFILIPRYGMYGTAIGYMLSEVLEIAISATIILIHRQRHTGNSINTTHTDD